MKLFLNAFLIFLLCKASISFTTFQKGKTGTVSASIGIIIFDSTDFEKNEDIKFEITATSFTNETLYYFFNVNNSIDNIDDVDNIGILDTTPVYTKNEDGHEINIYTISKTDKLNGNYLYLCFQCEGEEDVIIKNIYSTTSKPDNSYLKKGKDITVKGEDGAIIMETKDFNKGDEIYLKITADYFYDENIYCQFFDDLSTYEPNSDDVFKVERNLKKDNNYNENNDIISMTYYYTIKKDYTTLGNLKGDYLTIFFNCYGEVIITNTEENEGKLSKGAIIAIVVVVVVIGVGVIIFYCIKKKKMSQMTNNKETAVNNNQNYDNNDNQNYDNNYNQNYDNNNNNQNYQNLNMNMNSNNQMNNNYNMQQNNNIPGSDVIYSSNMN